MPSTLVALAPTQSHSLLHQQINSYIQKTGSIRTLIHEYAESLIHAYKFLSYCRINIRAKKEHLKVKHYFSSIFSIKESCSRMMSSDTL